MVRLGKATPSVPVALEPGRTRSQALAHIREARQKLLKQRRKVSSSIDTSRCDSWNEMFPT